MNARLLLVSENSFTVLVLSASKVNSWDPALPVPFQLKVTSWDWLGSNAGMLSVPTFVPLSLNNIDEAVLVVWPVLVTCILNE